MTYRYSNNVVEIAKQVARDGSPRMITSDLGTCLQEIQVRMGCLTLSQAQGLLAQAMGDTISLYCTHRDLPWKADIDAPEVVEHFAKLKEDYLAICADRADTMEQLADERWERDQQEAAQELYEDAIARRLEERKLAMCH